MKKWFLFLFYFPIYTIAASEELISDGDVKEYILVKNNAMKCFQTDLWESGSQEETTHFVERNIEVLFRYDVALMMNIFGIDTAVKIIEEQENADLVFRQKLQQLAHQDVSVQSKEDCQKLSEYFSEIMRKHNDP